MTDEQQRILVVVAGNYQQFVGFCRDNGFNPRQRGLVYAQSVETLYGLHSVDLAYAGELRHRRDLPELYARLRTMDVRRWQGPEEVSR